MNKLLSAILGLNTVSTSYQVVPPMTLLSAPSTGSVVGTLTAGMIVTGLSVSSDGNWIQVSTSTGLTGWLPAIYLVPSVPVPTPTPTPLPTGSVDEMWYLKDYEEIPMDANVGSFNALGGHGQNNWVQLGPVEIAWIQSLCPDNAALWDGWASANKGTIYIHSDTPGTVNWPIILMCSAGVNYDRQKIHVVEYSADHSQFRCEGIPQMSDYSSITLANHPWLFGAAYSCFGNGKYRLSANGKLFYMPIFDPMGGFKTSKGALGLWYPVSYLYSKL